MTLKFQDLVPDSEFSYEADHYNTGRHTLSLHEPKDNSIRQNYVIPQLSKRLSDSHRKLLDHLHEIGKAVLSKEYEVMAIERLRQIDFQEEVFQYLTNILHHVTPMTKLQHNHFHIEREDQLADDQCRRVCRLFPQFCDICVIVVDKLPNLVNCLSQYTQEDFEDNVQWLKCFYNCE